MNKLFLSRLGLQRLKYNREKGIIFQLIFNAAFTNSQIYIIRITISKKLNFNFIQHYMKNLLSNLIVKTNKAETKKWYFYNKLIGILYLLLLDIVGDHQFFYIILKFQGKINIFSWYLLLISQCNLFHPQIYFYLINFNLITRKTIIFFMLGLKAYLYTQNTRLLR